jgi:hypothetical protein
VFVPARFTNGCSLLGIALGVSQRGVAIFHSNQPKKRTHARLRACRVDNLVAHSTATRRDVQHATHARSNPSRGSGKRAVDGNDSGRPGRGASGPSAASGQGGQRGESAHRPFRGGRSARGRRSRPRRVCRDAPGISKPARGGACQVHGRRGSLIEANLGHRIVGCGLAVDEAEGGDARGELARRLETRDRHQGGAGCPRQAEALASRKDGEIREYGASNARKSSEPSHGAGRACTASSSRCTPKRARQEAVKEVHWARECPGRRPCLTLIWP